MNNQFEPTFENRQNEAPIEYDAKRFAYICPKCKGERIHVKSGMFIDLYTCKDCGYETRKLEYKKYDV